MTVIPYARQSIAAEDVEAVRLAVQAPFLTQGPGVAEFEARLCEVVGSRYAVVVNSGTAALHAAYAAAGVGPGKCVVTTPITFAATANASRYLGGDIRFVDVDPVYALLDPASLRDGLAPHEVVLAPVHFGGAAAPMEELRHIADASGAVVVEDAAHSLGTLYRDKKGQSYRVGCCAHSEMTCFSFHPVKHITTGEGGAVTTNDSVLARRLRRFRTHGITRDPEELIRNEGPWYYEQHDLGFNYRLPDLNCALGVSQIRRLSRFVSSRRRIASRYDEAFRGRKGIRVLGEPHWSSSAYHLYVIRVSQERRRAVFDDLRSRGLSVNVHYIPVYRHPYYRASGFADCFLVNAERFYAEAISIPIYADLSEEAVDRVIRTVLSQVTGEFSVGE